MRTTSTMLDNSTGVDVVSFTVGMIGEVGLSIAVGVIGEAVASLAVGVI